MSRVANKSLIASLLMLSFSLSIGFPFFDDFSGYTYTTDPAFMSNYTNMTRPYTHENLVFSMGNTYLKLVSSGLFMMNETKIQVSQPQLLTFGLLMKQNSYFYYACGYGNPVFSFLIYTNDTAGYKMDYSPTGANLYRCMDNITKDGGCNGPVIASTATDNITKENFAVVSGTCMFPYVTYPTAYTLGYDTPLVVSLDSYGYISLYWNNKLVLNARDSFPFYTNGSIGFGLMPAGTPYYYENSFIYLDNFYQTNASYSVPYGGGNFSVISYPDAVPNELTLVERVNSTIADWVAVNMPFSTQFSFNTPAGLMNPVTEAICPVRLDGEYNYYDSIETGNPNVAVKTADSNSLNKCVRRITYSDYNRYTTTYAGTPLGALFCLGYGLIGSQYCLFNGGDIIEQNKSVYDMPITEFYSGYSGWSDAWRWLDSSGRYYYTTAEIVCSSPANISLLVEYTDKDYCLTTPPDHLAGSFVYNVSVGINPDNNETCDISVNASCYNGSTYRKVDVPKGNGTPTDFCVQYPQLCYGTNETPAQRGGIDDVFSPEQGGGIVGMFSTPAFLGMFASLVVGAGIGWVAGPLLGIGGFIGSIVIATGYGLFPIWIGFVIAVLTAFATAILVKQGILG